jgi:hypothetical protein
MNPYEIILGTAAEEFVLTAPNQDRESLARSLREELEHGPNALIAYRFVYDSRLFTALPLSFNGIVAIHRPLTGYELDRLKRQERRRVASRGFYVADLLPPESAIHLPVAVRL